MIGRNWVQHPEVIYARPRGVLEDFTPTRNADGTWTAYYCHGPSLQNQRLHRAHAPTILGPYDNEEQREGTKHTRLYRGRIDKERRVITAVWPGLPLAGLHLFTEKPFGEIKELLVGPRAGTLYSIAAANPGVYVDRSGDVNIFFEGRDETVHWRMFHAVYRPSTGEVIEFTEPLFDGANPTVVEDGGKVYLFYSAYVGGGRPGFETRVCYQDVAA